MKERREVIVHYHLLFCRCCCCVVVVIDVLAECLERHVSLIHHETWNDNSGYFSIHKRITNAMTALVCVSSFSLRRSM